MITDTFTNNLGHCVHARVVVYMYLIFVMTGQNISNDGDKGVQICISPTFIGPSVYQGLHQCWMHVRDTDGRTDRQTLLFRARRKENETIVDRHADLKPCMYQMKGKTVVYELLKLQIGKMITVRTNT